MEANLTQRWRTLCTALHLRDAGATGDELVARYAEPHRRFHGHAHLVQVLDVLEALDADPRLHLAAWFHDAVYGPGRRDNERRSARLARRRLQSLGLPPADTDFVVRAVLATAAHAADDPDLGPLLDADLAVLGATTHAYRAYREALRAEYARFPDFLYARGRAAFLRGMLRRPMIYRTTAGRLRYEAQARINLRQELGEPAEGE